MDLLVSLLTITLISSALVKKTKLNCAAAPVTVLAVIALFLTGMGMLNLLFAAMIAVYIIAIACGMLVFWDKKENILSTLKELFQPGFVFFIVSTVVFWFTLKARGAGFRVWDEFSFWGTAAKMLHEKNQLYTLFQSSMINISYPPVLGLNSYFLQFLSPEFSEWKCYAAYDMLAMACVTPIFSRVRWKNPVGTLLCSFLGIFGIYEFYHTFIGLTPYATSYSDWMVGLVFGAALLVWYCGGEGLMRYFASMALLMILPITRDIGLALGLVAGGIMAVDMVIDGFAPVAKQDGKRRVLAEIGLGFALMLSVVLSYIAWSAHFAAAVDIPRVTIPYEYSIIDMFSGKDPYFNEIWRRMIDALSVNQLVGFGTVKEMVFVFTAVALCFAVIAKGLKTKLRFLSFALLQIFGFALYYIFHAYAYSAIFYHTVNYDLVCYARYLGSYPIGWYFALLGICAGSMGSPMLEEKIPEKLRFVWQVLPSYMLLAAAVFSIIKYAPNVPAKAYVIFSDEINVASEGIKELAEKQYRRFRGIFTDDTRVYVVAQDSDGGEWFVSNYVFMPAYTVSTFGGGNLVSPEEHEKAQQHAAETGEFVYTVAATRENFTQYLREQDVDVIFVLGTNAYFIEEFGPLFNDGLAERFDGSVYLYAVHDMGDSMEFRSFYSAEHYFELKQEWES